ncbi:hypothetical protein DFH06DRAFT_1138636 [Mycena polygramma]|nr:hypothetical protein DFH06DRAFT_1138636 [Mycena polygramma]
MTAASTPSLQSSGIPSLFAAPLSPAIQLPPLVPPPWLMTKSPTLEPVMVAQFSTSKPSSSCYLRIVPDPADPDTTPRFDLLDVWKEALEIEKPEWEVSWQPMADGRDKRMTVRFPDAGFKKAKTDKTPCAALEKVKTALTSQGMIITDSYSTATSGSYLTLANHIHVDSLIATGHITITAISPNPISVTRCRQIECLHAFEVVISGISEGEGAQSYILRWISKTIRDPIDKTSGLVDARTPDNEADCLVVWMTDWTATSRLLSSGDAFELYFKSKIPSIHRPQLLMSYNNEGLYRPKTVTETFRAGADSVNEAIKGLQTEMTEIRRENRVNHEATQATVSALTTSVTALFSQVENMSARLTNQASALLAMSTESSKRSQLAQIQMMMLQHRNTIRFGEVEDLEDTKAELALLKTQEANLNRSLTASAGQAVALLGGPIGRALPTPIPTAPSSVTPPFVAPGLNSVGQRDDRGGDDNPAKRARVGSSTGDVANDSNMTDVVSNPTSLAPNALIATREAWDLKQHLRLFGHCLVRARGAPAVPKLGYLLTHVSITPSSFTLHHSGLPVLPPCPWWLPRPQRITRTRISPHVVLLCSYSAQNGCFPRPLATACQAGFDRKSCPWPPAGLGLGPYTTGVISSLLAVSTPSSVTHFGRNRICGHSACSSAPARSLPSWSTFWHIMGYHYPVFAIGDRSNNYQDRKPGICARLDQHVLPQFQDAAPTAAAR